MLFDLTSISGQRVAQVDELHLGGRQWVSTTTLFIGAGGAVAGGVMGLALQITLFPGSMWVFLLIPIMFTAAIVLFGRRRSVEGEKTQTRAQKIWAKRTALDGAFIRPGSLEPFDPNGYEIIELHDHVIDR